MKQYAQSSQTENKGGKMCAALCNERAPPQVAARVAHTSKGYTHVKQLAKPSGTVTEKHSLQGATSSLQWCPRCTQNQDCVQMMSSMLICTHFTKLCRHMKGYAGGGGARWGGVPCSLAPGLGTGHQHRHWRDCHLPMQQVILQLL